MASILYYCLRMNSVKSKIYPVIVAILITVGMPQSSYADILNSDPGGWKTTISFDELSLENNQYVTNECSSFGVTFEDLKWFENANQDISWGGIFTSV